MAVTDRETFIFYRSFYTAIQKLDDPEAERALYRAIATYEFDGADSVDIPAKGAAAALWESFRPQLQANDRKRENAKGANHKQQPSETQANHEQDMSTAQATVKQEPSETAGKEKGNNAKGVKGKGEGKDPPAFSPPTLSDVETYCTEKGLTLNAEKFVAHYQSTGWMAGKNPVTNWKALADRWAAEDKERAKTAPAAVKNRFDISERADYGDMAELERKLLGGG